MNPSLEQENDRLRGEVSALEVYARELDTTALGQKSAFLQEMRIIAAALLLALPASALPGVYFLLSATGEVVYVGQSSNVATRLGGHRDKEFVDVRMVFIQDEDQRSRYEQLMIKALSPRYNVAMNPGRAVSAGSQQAVS